MPRWIRLGMLAMVAVSALSGCGTVMNLQDKPTTYFRRYPGTDANRVYGGVRIDAEQGYTLFDLDPFVATYFWAVDLPLSAVADTITLPITIKSALDRKSGLEKVVEPATHTDPVHEPAQIESSPGNAFTQLAGNKFDGPWTASFICLGPDRMAFEKGDRVKVKASADGPTMTVEYVPTPIYIDSRYYSGSERVTMSYRCRWKNKDGSESVGAFQVEELEPVPVGGDPVKRFH